MNVRAELRHAAVMAGYWLRPYDMVADRRRWRWQPRELCQYQDQAEVLRRWLAERELVVDVYPVGVVDALQPLLNGAPRAAWDNLRATARYVTRRARRGEWRAVRMEFNGYLAEPRDFPPGVTRCGSGWTRRRARADLDRRIRRAAQ